MDHADRRNPGGEHRRLLDLRWQDADDVDTRHRHQRAQRLHSEFRLAACDDGSHGIGRNHPRLAFHLFDDAQAVKHDVGEIYAARAVGVGDRSRFKHRSPERVQRTDVRLRCPGAHRDADVGLRQLRLTCGTHLSILRQRVELAVDHDDDVGVLAAAQPVRDRLRRLAHRRAARRDHGVLCSLRE